MTAYRKSIANGVFSSIVRGLAVSHDVTLNGILKKA